MEYDVFISCKSEDYKYAEEIYEFLTSNGINTFLASKELREVGDSEYRRAISNAMKSTYHMIVFASKAEYIDSSWVYYEWDMFLNAKLKGFKQGQIITILKDVKIESINMDLWKYESFCIEDYKDRILGYVETPQYWERKKEKEKKEQEIIRRQKAREHVIILAEEYKKKMSEIQSIDIPKILKAMQSANITHRLCPICGTSIKVSDYFCHNCCWNLSPIDGIEEIEYLVSGESRHIQAAKERNTSIENLRNENRKLSESLKETIADDSLKLELRDLRNALNRRTAELEECKTLLHGTKEESSIHLSKLKATEQELKQLREEIQKLKTSNESSFSNKWRRAFPKLKLENISDIIMQSSSYPGAIFSYDKISSIGFDINTCRDILSRQYHLDIPVFDFYNCKTVGDIKSMIAKKAGL